MFGSRVVQTAVGTGRLAEVPGNHQGAHRSAGGSTGQLGGDRERDTVSLESYIKNLLTEEIPLWTCSDSLPKLECDTRASSLEERCFTDAGLCPHTSWCRAGWQHIREAEAEFVALDKRSILTEMKAADKKTRGNGCRARQGEDPAV